jgi:hypothetical protein
MSACITIRSAPLVIGGSTPAVSHCVCVPVDPTPFLSTVVLTSAAFVAIVGGLFVAKFVTVWTKHPGSPCAAR